MKIRAGTIAVLVMCCGSAMSQTEWINPDGGNWNVASNWDPEVVPNSAGISVLLPGLINPYTVFLDLNASVFSCEITSDVTLSLDAGRTLSFAGGGIVNNGLIFVNTTASTSNVVLRSIDAATITGMGRIELNSTGADLFDAQITGSIAPLTIGASQTIGGSGVVAGSIFLQGVIDADRESRDIQLTGTIDAGGGGVIQASNGGNTALVGTVIGGTLAGNVHAQGGSATIDGSTSIGVNGVRPGSTLNILSGGLVNDGTWIVNTTGSTSNALMRSIMPAAISGVGNIELNSITSDLFDAQLAGTAGAPVEIGISQTVNGSGVVQGPVVLTGMINADRNERDILIRGEIIGTATGAMQGTGGGKVAFEAVMSNGNLSGGVEAQGSSGNLNGVASTGVNGVRPGSTLNILSGGLVNDGTWIVNTTGSFSNAMMRSIVPAAISGVGNIELNSITSDLFDAQVGGTTDAALTLDAHQKVTGSGVVQGPVVLLGTIEANRDGRDIETRGVIDASGGGVVQGVNGASVSLFGTTLIGGTIAGNVEATSGSTTYNGTTAVSTNGVRPGAVLGIVGAGLVNNGTIVVNTTGSFSDAAIAATQTPVAITGSGNIELNSTTSDLGDAQIRGSVDIPLTIGTNQSITGSGLMRGPIFLDGIVNANREGRNLRLLGGTGGSFDATNGGRLVGTEGGTVTLSGADWIGGHWLGGVEIETGSTTVTDVVMQGVNGLRGGATMTIVSPTVTNNGTLVVNTNASFSNAVINATVDTTIQGEGTILLAAATGDLGDANLSPVGTTITIAADQTIAGRGLINGSTRILGTVSPGSETNPTQEIQFNIAPELDAMSRFKFGIAGSNAVDYDRLTGNAPWMLDGTFTIELLDGYVPPFNTRFTILTGTNITGQPHTVNVPQVGIGIFRLQFSATKVEAVWTCEADVNADGVLDFFDVQYFLNAYTNQALYGDYNGDGVIDFFDVQAFLNDYSQGCF